jgi:hypothetical protein
MNKTLNEILKEIGIYLIFLFFLYYVSFKNLSSSAYTYNQLFQQTFVDPQSSNEIGLNDVFIFKYFLLANLSLALFLFYRLKHLTIFGLGQ